MTYDLIKTFLSLAETKNFNRTAELLYISQPTVTARIKTLEAELGQALFTRDNKNVELTPAGFQFLHYATQIYQIFNEGKSFMKDFDRHKQKISLSAPATNWDYGPFRSHVITYAKQNPEIFFSLNRATSDGILSSLAADFIDLGLVYKLPNNAETEVVPYFQEELLLVANPEDEVIADGNSMTGKNGVPPLVKLEYGATANKLAEETFYMLPYNIITDHPSLHLKLVTEGFGIGLIQQSVAEADLNSGRLILIDCEYNRHPLLYKSYFAYLKRKEPLVRDLVNFLLACVQGREGA